jgi:PAS domain S-box-containing protein
MKVLVVDDIPANRKLLRAILEGEGHDVTEANDGMEALGLLKNRPVDAIISDILMPRMDGYRLCYEVRASESLRRVPFIFYTSSYTSDSDEKLALEMGADDFLTKPSPAEDILKALHLATTQPRIDFFPAEPAHELNLMKEYNQQLVDKLEQKNVELTVRNQELEISEQKLLLQSTALEMAANAILLTDVNGVILWVNPAFLALTGYSEEEVIGQTPSLLRSGEHNAAFFENLWNTIRSGKIWRGSFVNRRKDGTLYRDQQTITPVCSSGKEITHFISIITDMTEVERLQAQFIEAQKMEVVGHLAGGVAHDFNNVLGVIMGYSDLAQEELPPDHPLQLHIEEIRHAAKRAAGLTQQLLIFSRKQTIKAVELNLNAVVADMERMLRQLINENVEMTLSYGEDVGMIKADSGHLWQVLMNLVVNARDAMPEGGKLIIKTRSITLDEAYAQTHPKVAPGPYAVLSVEDSGIGMDAEVRSRLFEAFFTTKAPGKGTGLGLITCQTIVNQSGGHIEVISEVGKGTTFKVYLPQIASATPVVTGSTPTVETIAHGTETVLLVEDEPSLRHLAEGVLKNHGYTVLTAPNGQDALRVAREHTGEPIALVVTDVIMPRMGGKVMAEWLKTSYPDIKVLFASGYAEEAIVHEGVLEKGIEFLPKPYTPGALAGKVRELLNAS